MIELFNFQINYLFQNLENLTEVIPKSIDYKLITFFSEMKKKPLHYNELFGLNRSIILNVWRCKTLHKFTTN